MKKIDQVDADADDWLPDDVYDYCFDPDDGVIRPVLLGTSEVRS